MKEIRFSSYRSNEVKVALLLPILLIPIALILIFVAKADWIAFAVGLLLPSFFIAIIITTLLIKNISEKEELIFSNTKLEIFFKNAPYLSVKWEDINKIEIIKEKFEIYIRHQGMVIKVAHNLKFFYSKELLEYRLWWIFFNLKEQEQIISTLKEFSEVKYIEYEIHTNDDIYSNTISLLQRHYNVKDQCKREHYRNTISYHYSG